MTNSFQWNPFHRWEVDRDKARSASSKWPWDKKESKIFWRGEDTGFIPGYQDEFHEYFFQFPFYFPRMQLVWHSHLYPDKINARFSQTRDFNRKKMEEMGMP